jgi:high-affinity nickel-transport protein
VILAGALLVAGVSLAGTFMAEGTSENLLLGLIGSGVSGLFLLAMGLLNGSAFLRTVKILRGARNGAEVVQSDLAAGGFVARLLTRPLAFAAAMTLCDTINGVAMMRMYRSALDDPRGKRAFNAAITGISSVSALFIAILTLGSMPSSAFGLRDPLTTWLASVDLGDAGLLLVGCLMSIWAAAALRHRPR